jgi:hypothetical protein
VGGGAKATVTKVALAAFFALHDCSMVDKVDLILKTVGSGKKLLKMLQAKYGAVPDLSHS